MQTPFTKHEGDMSRKMEPRSLHCQEEYENTMKMPSNMPEDNISRKMEPRGLHSDEVFDNTMKISLSTFGEDVSRKREPGSLPSDQIPEENSMQISISKPEDDMNRRIEPGSLYSQEEYENTMKMHSTIPEDGMSRRFESGLLSSGQETYENSMMISQPKRSHIRERQPQDEQTEDPSKIKEIIQEADEEEKGVGEGSKRVLEKSAVEKRTISSQLKLESAMKELSQIPAQMYMENAHRIMQQLHQESNEGDSFLRWVRFLDISAQKFESFHLSDEIGREAFKREIENLVFKVLLSSHSDHNPASTIDWRIAKKILSLPHLFPRLISSIHEEDILKATRNEVEKALDQMVWSSESKLSALAKDTLQALRKPFEDKSYLERLKQALIVGRFDKAKFGLSNSLILGEDGGLYLLLNRLTKEQQTEMIKLNIITEDYLKDKIIENSEGDDHKKGDKIVLGKGGFGTVRFALSLFRNKSDCGDVVCIKKTRNFAHLASRKHQNPLQIATEAIIDDYFASDVADKVYAPQVFDLAIISVHLVNKENERSIKECHQKGYLMMEVFPQNTAAKIFLEPKYQKWKYQKPYLQEVVLATSELLKNGIAFTDLKPANTLFDPETLKTTFIDLGGSIQLEAGALDVFDKRKHSSQSTPGYFAPEMMDTEITIISISKALAFSCGKVIQKITKVTDYNGPELPELIEKLTRQNPDQRMSIDQGFEYLKTMGDDTDNKNFLLEQYITKIRRRIEHNQSSISLNEDILTTKELYIDLKVTPRDPERYGNQETEDLFQKIDSFFAPDQLRHQVMAVLGSAGSGKSIALQLKFIEAVQNWTKSQPLPFYFNLANGIVLKSVISSMNSELGINIKLHELHEVHLYIDSFDEGMEIEKKRETLIRDYIAELKTINTKVLITCRSNYLENESSVRWFTPQLNAYDRLTIHYVAPMSYIVPRESEKKYSNLEETKENADAEGSVWKKHVATYLKLKQKKNAQLNQKELSENQKRKEAATKEK